jgi:hypothetical protein
MAASVAAELSKENNCEVQTTSGGLGEFSVSIDGDKVLDTNRFWYPSTKNVLAKIRERLSQKTSKVAK